MFCTHKEKHHLCNSGINAFYKYPMETSKP